MQTTPTNPTTQDLPTSPPALPTPRFRCGDHVIVAPTTYGDRSHGDGRGVIERIWASVDRAGTRIRYDVQLNAGGLRMNIAEDCLSPTLPETPDAQPDLAESPYWLVDGPGSTTNHRHPTLDEALLEAHRLVDRNPGMRFSILRAVEFVEVQVEKTKIARAYAETGRARDTDEARS